MSRNNPVVRDFLRNKLVVAILIIGMIPVYMKGYLMYIFILLLPLVFVTRFNAMSWIILLFSAIYTTTSLFFIEVPMSMAVFYYTFPIIIYQTGLYLSKRFRSPDSMVALLIFIAIAFGFPAVASNITDYINTGNLVNFSRTVEANGDTKMSATIYGILLSVLCGSFGVLFVPSKGSREFVLKQILSVFSFFALFSTIHLANRTGIALAGISIICAIFTPTYTFKRLFFIVATAMILLVVYNNYVAGSFEIVEVMDHYKSRGKDSSISSFGLRDKMWAQGVDIILENPLGSSMRPILFGRKSYAHNIVLDAGLVGGVVSALLMLLIYLVFLFQSFRVFRKKNITPFNRFIIMSFTIMIFIQSMIEPVLEGRLSFFLFGLMIMGITRKLSLEK